MITKNFSMTRGQTISMTGRAKNSSGYVSLTGAKIFMWIRADMKVDAQVKLASEATLDHRIGIDIDPDQIGSGKGRFVVTMIPVDTESLVALGADDPYLYDIWAQLSTGEEFPIVNKSSLDLYPQVTTIP